MAWPHKTEPGPWTVGFYGFDSAWVMDRDEGVQRRVAAALAKFLSEGDEEYGPNPAGPWPA